MTIQHARRKEKNHPANLSFSNEGEIVFSKQKHNKTKQTPKGTHHYQTSLTRNAQRYCMYIWKGKDDNHHHENMQKYKMHWNSRYTKEKDKTIKPYHYRPNCTDNKREERNKRYTKQPGKVSKMTGVSPHLLITLHVNRLNSPIRKWLNRLLKTLFKYMLHIMSHLAFLVEL